MKDIFSWNKIKHRGVKTWDGSKHLENTGRAISDSPAANYCSSERCHLGI